MKMTPEEFELGLAQATGSQGLHHGMFPTVRYTDGIKYMADNGGAHWLIDLIAIQLRSRKFARWVMEDARLAEQSFWRMTCSHNGTCRQAYLKCQADKGVRSKRIKIPFTDFPLDSIDIWVAADGDKWIMYLPTEH